MSFAVGMVGSNVSDLRDKIRARLDVDLYYAGTALFHLDFFDADYHRNMAAFYWDDKTYPHKLVLGPRGGGKTTWRIVKLALKFLRTPDTRSMIVSYNLDKSWEIARYLDETLLSRDINQPMLNMLFPDVMKVWRATERPQNKPWFFSALNQSGKKDPHFAMKSIDSGVTGSHVDDLYCDDLVDEISARSKTECERAVSWIETTENALEHQIYTPWDVVGTHYNLFDPYAEILTNPKFSHFKPFVHPGLLSTTNLDGTTTYSSYWPSKFSVEDLIEMRTRQGEDKFASLIQQDPVQSGDAPFQESDFRWWKWDGDRQIRGYDRHGHLLFVRHFRDLTIGIVWDPALDNDHTRARNAVMCAAMDSDENIFVLDPWALKCDTDKSLTAFLAMAIRYEPDFVGCEEVLFQKLLLPVLSKQLEDESIAAHNPMPLTPKGRSKDVRILATQIRFKRHKVFINPEHENFIHEVVAYPKGKTRDLLDVFAYACEHLWPPARTTVVDAYGHTVQSPHSIREQGANRTTGY